MMAIVNYNTDVSDFWEFSATGFRPINEANEAYNWASTTSCTE